MDLIKYMYLRYLIHVERQKATVTDGAIENN